MIKNTPISTNFIKNIVTDDLDTGKYSIIITRFPPEPNGYLHIGHAKSICLNFGLAQEFNGICNLRFDDTNPEKETDEYVNSIQNDIRWLGFKWDKEVKYASDYFDELYNFAIHFIKKGLAYVCDLTPDQIRDYRGNLITPGIDSQFRSRSITENLTLFEQMKNGDFADSSKTLRLKIDMKSPNINMRDPVIYRIKHAHHIRTGNKWCIYPMYDYTHCISDALENITHSCCTLEFADHRPLYDWIIDQLVEDKLLTCHPQQIEFSRLELQYTITSKRKLNQLVTDKLVSGWDDPRMPTISGMRRRGYTPDGIKLFASRCGISKSPNIVDLTLLETSIREDLENNSPRVMAVINPLKITLTNFSDDVQNRNANFHPQKSELGERLVELSPEIYIERDDFMESAINGWQRLTKGGEVRLRYSYIIKCNEVIKSSTGEIIELKCTLDKKTLGKNPEGRKVKGVIHWVSISKSVLAEVRLYDRLLTIPNLNEITVNTSENQSLITLINPQSLLTTTVHIEPSIVNTKPEDKYQFERLGYFVADLYDYTNDKPVFNRIVSLKDTWKKNNND